MEIENIINQTRSMGLFRREIAELFCRLRTIVAAGLAMFGILLIEVAWMFNINGASFDLAKSIVDSVLGCIALVLAVIIM